MGTSSVESSSERLPVRGGLALIYASSLVIALMTVAVSLAGLLNQSEVYPSEELIQAFLPNDVANLVIGLPILIGSLWLAWRGKLLGLLFWPGSLFYVLYNYLVYLFAMPLGWAWLLYLALVMLSAYSTIALVASIDGQTVRRRLTGAVPERVAGGVLVGLGTLFLVRVVAVVVEALISLTPLPKTELALLVADFLIAPALIIGGVLLWRRRALGYVGGTGLLFQASMLFVSLILILLLQPFLTGTPFAPVDVLVVFIMGLICFIPFGLFVRGVVRS
jgi:hypothetical protein